MGAKAIGRSYPRLDRSDQVRSDPITVERLSPSSSWDQNSPRRPPAELIPFAQTSWPKLLVSWGGEPPEQNVVLIVVTLLEAKTVPETGCPLVMFA